MSGVALAFSGRAVLIVGVERHENGALRVYIGSRGDGRYFLAPRELEADFERAWNGSFTSHLVIDRAQLDGVPIFSEAA